MSWESVKLMKGVKDDPLRLVLLIIRNLFDNKIFKIIQYIVFFINVTFTVLIAFLFFKNRNLDFTTQYIAHWLSTLSAVIFNLIQFLEESSMKLRDDIFKHLWSLDCAPKRLKDKLLKEAVYVKIYVTVNTAVGVLTGVIMYPVGTEEDYQFPLHLCKTYFPNYFFELKILYILTFPVISLTMINFANILVYVTFHARGQILLFLEYLKNIESDYNDFDDDTLYHDENYQTVVTKRLHFLLGRHIELIRHANNANDIATKLIPTLSLATIIMGLAIMCYFYLGLLFGSWCYVQMVFWIFTFSLTGGIAVYCGQELENVSLSTFDLLYGTRWITWSKSNRKMLQIMMVKASEPFQLKFLQNYIVNFDFGVRMLKLLYSFAAVMHRFQDYNLAKY